MARSEYQCGRRICCAWERQSNGGSAANEPSHDKPVSIPSHIKSPWLRRRERHPGAARRKKEVRESSSLRNKYVPHGHVGDTKAEHSVDRFELEPEAPSCSTSAKKFDNRRTAFGRRFHSPRRCIGYSCCFR